MLFSSPMENGEMLYYRRISVPMQSDVSVIEVGKNQVPKNHYRAFKRNLFIIHYIVGGKGTFMGRAFDKNCIYCVVPGQVEIHKADEGDPYESYWVMLRGERVPELLRKCGFPEHNAVLPFAHNQAAASILKQAIFNITPKNEFEEGALMQAAFYALLALHAQDAKVSVVPSLTMQGIKNYIKDNYHRPIKISELAAESNYSRSYLYSAFKREYHVSPQEYLLNCRVERAKQLLADTSVLLTVKEVSFAVGFEDPLYFSRLFRKKTGMSPTEYKKTGLRP